MHAELPFLQTAAWARFERALGREVRQQDADGWSYSGYIEKGPFNSRFYCPYGPVVTSANALQDATTALMAEARHSGCTFIRVEPRGPVTAEQLTALGYRRVGFIQPSDTWQVDLTQPEDQILADMRTTNRNLYRNFAKKGLSIRTSNDPADIEMLTSLLHGVAAHNTMTPHTDSYFTTQATVLMPSKDATLYTAWYEGAPIAAALAYDGPDTRYYAHAAADYEHRKLSAGSILLTRLMLDAKAAGKSTFDFWGIAPDDAPADHPWSGFTAFKKSFGGHAVHYLGTWEKPVRSLHYAAYRLALKVLGRTD